MNSIYIGDRPLDPPEDDECETCNGGGFLHYTKADGSRSHGLCPDCQQDNDPGEPNDYPED